MPSLKPFAVASGRYALFWLSLALAMTAARSAQAHMLGGPMGGFGSGFEHPLLGPDHFLAMLAVGLWGAQLGGRAVWSLPATFPLIMCLGGIAGMTEIVPMPFMELGIGLSVVVLGLAIAVRWRAHEFIALALISVFAIFHGYAHGQELPGAADPAAYAVGFVVATGLIHVAGVAIGMLLGKVSGGRLIQVLGGLVALCGLYFVIDAVI